MTYTIIVTYNSMRWADKCFGGLQASLEPTSVVVIDNGSTDGTVLFIKTNYPDVQIIETGENLGFAKANNIGIRYALDKGADYIFLLNHDAWVEKDTIGSLIRTMKKEERVGIVSPIHLTGDYSAIDSPFLTYMPQEFNDDKESGALKESYELTYVNAAAWMMNAKMIREVGGFDTLLFKHYGEDNNLCQRARYFGWKILVDTRVSICHDRLKRVAAKDFKEGVLGQRAYEIEAKSVMGDITKNIPIIYHIIRQAVLTMTWLVFFNLQRANIHWNLTKAYVLVRKSRMINKKGGLIWL